MWASGGKLCRIRLFYRRFTLKVGGDGAVGDMLVSPKNYE